MEKFTTLEPVRLYASNILSRSNGNPHTPQKVATLPAPPRVGKLPADLHLLVLQHLPVPDLPAYARASRATRDLAKDELVWEGRWKALGVERWGFGEVLEEMQREKRGQGKVKEEVAVMQVGHEEFGDFEVGGQVAGTEMGGAAVGMEDMGDFVGAFAGLSVAASLGQTGKETFRANYTRAHGLLKPLTKALNGPPHLVLEELRAVVSAANSTGREYTLRRAAKTLHLLSCFLSSRVQPVRGWATLWPSLRAAMDRFDATLLAAFDEADGRGNETAMREAAESSWEVWDGMGDWEMGKVWAEKREIFYVPQGRWDPMSNFREDGALDFDSMHEFVEEVLAAMEEHGCRAVRVFPPEAQVLLSFADRLATEVVGEYITSLLTRAREVGNETYLKAAAASFKEAWRMIDAILKAASQRKDVGVSTTKAEDVVYQMFEVNMDEYLDEEVESLKLAFDMICTGWEKQMASHSPPSPGTTTARFLASHNPAQVKRNVLASFTNVLLLPVTIVPRTMGAVGGALMTGGTAAAQGIAMLNPQRWGGGGGVSSSAGATGYSKNLEKDGGTLFEMEDDDDEIDEKTAENNEPKISSTTPSRSQVDISAGTTASPDQLDLLLSLDIALELIHADRESLKRVETFASYPGHYGHRVRDTIEEIFVLMLQALGEQHVSKGFAQATERMLAYKPDEHEETTSVAPLLQFFELVHIGDTIQSMVQVYFEKELAPHIDKTDFLNAVVREKKRYENSLDDSVAAGLNAGTEVLMNQVEHIILTLTKPREYYPPEDSPLDLGPTRGCTEAIKCLEMHCKLLKGSTNKEVLEVFYQEVGIRLIAILQKHIKRQIISLNGGFQVIADLNAYHTFISSLKVPAITADFSYLKMLGHVYVVEDAKDLAQIVRDVTRYGGAYRPEDIYEFIQRRSDWKRIEKIVDKTMYNLSFKEDCVIS